jgi:hypothetical protein
MSEQITSFPANASWSAGTLATALGALLALALGAGAEALAEAADETLADADGLADEALQAARRAKSAVSATATLAREKTIIDPPLTASSVADDRLAYYLVSVNFPSASFSSPR